MRKETDFLFGIYLFFMILLIASGTLRGALGELVYYLAFVLPIAIGFIVFKRQGENERSFVIVNKRIVSTLPLIVPSVQIIMTVSFVTSFVLGSLVGRSPSVDLPQNVFLALIYHALLPSVLEELLFRYLPIRLFGESRRAAVIVSSLSFALVHHSFFSFGYAFIAGVIFALVDIATDSILPSVILHFVNNALSVLWMLYSGDGVFRIVFYAAFLLLYAISAIFLFIYRKKYTEMLSDALVGDAPRFSFAFIFLALPSLLLAVFEIF